MPKADPYVIFYCHYIFVFNLVEHALEQNQDLYFAQKAK